MKTPDITGGEIDRALEGAGVPYEKLFNFCTIGDISHPLKVMIGRVLSSYAALHSSLTRSLNDRRLLEAELYSCEQIRQDLMREIERLSAHASLP